MSSESADNAVVAAEIGAWHVAPSTCGDTLNAATYGTHSADGYSSQSDWRLPTQKELFEAYTHGLVSANSPNWLTLSDLQTDSFWSASSFSGSSNNAWYVLLGYGGTSITAKTEALPVVCVRP